MLPSLQEKKKKITIFCMVSNCCWVYQPLCIKQTFNKLYHPICESNIAQCGPQLDINDTANWKIRRRGKDNVHQNRLKPIH